MAKRDTMSHNQSRDYSTSINIPQGKIYPWVHYLLAFALVIIAYWGVTANSDWGSYERWFENDASETDKAFMFLTSWFTEHRLTYRMLYRFHIFLIASLFTLLFWKLRVNPILFTVLMLLFNYVALGNQIRYYVGFPLALLALQFFVEKKYVWAALLGIIAFFFHSSLILFFAVFIFYYYFLIHIRRGLRIFIIILVNVVLFFVIQRYTGVSGTFEAYLINENQISGTLGGIYNLMPSFIYIYFAYSINKDVTRICPLYTNTTEYKFLYSCIMMGSVLFMCSIKTQIIAHRMMGMALMPIWLTYFIRVKELKVVRINKQVVLLLLIFFFFYTLHLLGVFTGADNYIYSVKEMFNSYTLR